MYVGGIDTITVSMVGLLADKLPQRFRVNTLNPKIDRLAVHVLTVSYTALMGIPFLAA